MSENVSTSPYAEAYRKIGYYRANSSDASFHAYLDKKLEEAEKGLVLPNQLCYDLDVNYARYQEVLKSRAQSTQTEGHGNETVYVNAGEEAANALSEAEKKKKRTELEVKIGVGVLSAIGAAFILVALIYFGKYFLDDIYLGILVYAIGFVCILISEIVLEKKVPSVAHVITGLGFLALFTATVFSTISLNMFEFEIAAAVIFAIAIFNIVFAKIRKSPVLEAACSLGTFGSLYLCKDTMSLEQFMIIGGLILLINLILFITVNSDSVKASKLIRLFVFAVSVFALLSETSGLKTVEGFYRMGFLVLAVFVVFMLYAVNTEDMVTKCTCLAVIGAFSLMTLGRSFELDMRTLVFAGGYFIVCLLSFLAMLKKKEKWSACSVFLLVMFCGAVNLVSEHESITLLVLIVVLVVSKALSSVEATNITDTILTVMGFVCAVHYCKDPLSYVIVGVLFIGCFMAKRFKLFYEISFTVGAIAFAAATVPKAYTIPVLLLILFILLLVFNLVEGMQVRGTKVYNICVVSVMGLATLCLPLQNRSDMDELIVCIAALVIGLACILTVFRKKFFMETKARYMILAVFLTYVACFSGLGRLWISVSLMAVAFVMIAVGCIANRFEIRLYGLILSLLVCVKVAFYDFKSEDEFSRMIVFLVVGVLAIAISAIYLILEKKEQKELKALRAQNGEYAAPAEVKPSEEEQKNCEQE